VAGYSTVTGVDADRLRTVVFDAFWVKGLDIGDASVLGELGCPTGPPRVTMQWWHDEWLGFDRPVVPMVVLPGGIRVKRLRFLEATCRTRHRWQGQSVSEVGRSCPRTPRGIAGLPASPV
jgi:hypothetical protein